MSGAAGKDKGQDQHHATSHTESSREPKIELLTEKVLAIQWTTKSKDCLLKVCVSVLCVCVRVYPCVSSSDHAPGSTLTPC